MINILIHGLGQNNTSWNNVIKELKKKHIIAEAPNLFKETQNLDYEFIYNAFKKYCNSFKGKINLCGLSLGGILALNYINEYPQKVNKLVLIGTSYQIPKTLFKIQTLIFKCMPKKTFMKMGYSKKAFIKLVSSIAKVEVPNLCENIFCQTLIICGKKDITNKKSASKLNAHIANSEVKFIPNASHEVNLDNPEILSSILATFWKKC